MSAAFTMAVTAACSGGLPVSSWCIYGQLMLDLDKGWRTERLNLEPLSVAHVAEMGPLLDDPSLHEFTGGVPLSTDALAVRYAKLARRRSPDGEQRWGNWVMRLRSTAAAVGTVQATLPAGGPAAGPAEISWVVASRAQGHGYAKEAARSLADLLIDDGWPVTAYIHPGHLVSQHIASSAGLAPTTTVRQDEVCWIRLPVMIPDPARAASATHPTGASSA